ncbi:hypothetical protein Barb4_01351 [Bacteroidales bacterium Barb4]|nr:hypothetical protein Barb4_01351 [Bacteroidales bacterium Barb4]
MHGASKQDQAPCREFECKNRDGQGGCSSYRGLRFGKKHARMAAGKFNLQGITRFMS